MMRYRVILLVLSFTLACSAAHARWATRADAEAVTEFITREVTVRKDGTYHVVTEMQLEILKEGGRSLSNFRLSYNSRAGKLNVLRAETINGDKRHPVESGFIEDKPQASRLTGFDETNLVTIAFPKVSIGSKLLLKWEEHVSEVPMPGHYSARFRFGDHWYMETYSLVIRSELELFIDRNDPGKSLKVEQEKSGETYVTRVNLKSPLYTRAVDEPSVSMNPKDETWIVVSNFKTFPKMAEVLAESYDKIVMADLPPSFEKIAKAAKSKKNTIERLNTITSMLAEEVRYMGDWRPIRGGHVPRPLETIAKTRFGDCKDMAAVTTAILRKLGIKANVAWVERGMQPTPLPEIALTGAFNHAIVRAEHAGKVYWVDPTNFASFAQGVYEDIAARQALIVEPGHSRLDQIPLPRPSTSKREIFTRTRILPEGDADIEMSLKYGGRMALWCTGAQLKKSKEQFDHWLLSSLTDESRLKWNKIEPYHLKSRVVRDTTFRLGYGERDYSIRTTMGSAFHLDQRLASHLLKLETDKRVSDVFLGYPHVIRNVDHVENVRLLGRTPPTCSLDSPWMSVSRQIKQLPTGIKITDVRTVKKTKLTREEYKSRRFKRFREKLRECFDRVAVVYEQVGERVISSTVEPQ